MTGFGSSDISTPEMEGKVEIKTLNHKYLDINVKGPRDLFSLEETIRQEISRKITRGRVEVRVKLDFSNQYSNQARLNPTLADSYYRGLQELQQMTGEQGSLLHILAKMPEVFILEQEGIDEEKLWEGVNPALHAAVDKILVMKAKEGERLKTDIENHGEELQTIVKQINERKDISENKAYKKLTERLNQLLSDSEVEHHRIVQEAAIASDKANIDEELVRMNSHLQQLNEFTGEQGAVGKKMDFLVQEMIREINTIASKSNDEKISRLTINAKSTIEKIREQVQNVE